MRLYTNKKIKSIEVLLGLAMLFSCKTNPVKMEALSKELNEPTVSTTEIEWFYTKNGKASFKLNSPEMFRFDGEDPYLEFPKGIELESFEEKGNKDAYLRADYAIQHLKDKLIEEKLETEYLIWDEAKELIYTEEFVKITKNGQVIMGEGFESDIYFSEYTLKKSRGIINLDHAE
jgi:LPS export ABC transporter protein LptC